MSRTSTLGLTLGHAALAIVAAAGLTMAISEVGNASPDRGLSGSWSGGGSVTLPSGATEKARCKATFQRNGGNDYAMSAVCATASTRISQSAQVHQVGPSRFSGVFHNPDYNVSGTIRISLNGNSLNASLDGGGGSGSFHLTR